MIEKQFYVYQHIDKNDKCRYIGKGKGYRANDKRNRNPHWKNVFKDYFPKVEIVAKDLTEDDAHDLEIWLIKEARRAGWKICNIADGGEGRCLFAQTECKKKKIMDFYEKHNTLPSRCSKDKEERRLHSRMRGYVDSKSATYDPDFEKQIRPLMPGRGIGIYPFAYRG